MKGLEKARAGPKTNAEQPKKAIKETFSDQSVTCGG
jgi:hypothetical protein